MRARSRAPRSSGLSAIDVSIEWETRARYDASQTPSVGALRIVVCGGGLHHLAQGPHRVAVPGGSQSRDDRRGDHRDVRALVMRLAAVDVRDVQLDDRAGKHLERVENREGRE